MAQRVVLLPHSSNDLNSILSLAAAYVEFFCILPKMLYVSIGFPPKNMLVVRLIDYNNVPEVQLGGERIMVFLMGTFERTMNRKVYGG